VIGTAAPFSDSVTGPVGRWSTRYSTTKLS
jgi:hypothetical protein